MSDLVLGPVFILREMREPVDSKSLLSSLSLRLEGIEAIRQADKVGS